VFAALRKEYLSIKNIIFMTKISIVNITDKDTKK